VAHNYGQFAYAGGTFSAAGDAQTSIYVLRGITTTGTPTTNLFLDGISEVMKVPVDSRWAFDALIVASMTGSTTASWQVRGAIKNIAGTTSMLIGAPAPQSLGADSIAASWSVTALADNTRDALMIQVTNPGGGIVHWVASVRVVELAF
jgi:hypothetical protein